MDGTVRCYPYQNTPTEISGMPRVTKQPNKMINTVQKKLLVGG